MHFFVLFISYFNIKHLPALLEYRRRKTI